MIINIEEPIKNEPEIIVVGVGGGGGNAVNTMIDHGIGNVKYIASNTDYQALESSKAPIKLQLGEKLTRGLGAGADPSVGKKAAEESTEAIKAELHGADMVFVTAGMGGGTGTGAAPIIAKIAKELGALTVAVVTTPFDFEGKKKMQQALEGLDELKKNVDSYMVISNNKITKLGTGKMTIKDAFAKGNEVLRQAVGGIITIITSDGSMNADFADIKTIMSSKGRAHVGLGVAKGENRAMESVKMAINSPLLDTSIKGANHILTYVTASEESFSMDEFASLNDFIAEEVGIEPENVIVGFGFSKEETEDFTTIVIATELPGAQMNQGSVAGLDGLDIDFDENKEEDSENMENVADIKIEKAERQTDERELNLPSWMKRK